MTTIATNSSKGITLSDLDTTIANGVSISNSSNKNVINGPSSTAWTLVNYGHVSGKNSNAVTFANGGYISNASSGVISDKQAVYIAGAAGTVVNAGTMTGTYYGVHLAAGGSVTNAAGGLITGVYKSLLFGGNAGTVANAGSLGGGVYFYGTGSNFITNAAGGVIAGAKGVFFGNSVVGEVSNAGSIVASYRSGVEIQTGGSVSNSGSGVISGYYGVQITNDAGTVVNFGTITGTQSFGVALLVGGYVGNSGSGVINGVLIYGAAGTVVNAGSIIGDAFAPDGVYLTAGGTVANAGSGVISGTVGIDIKGGAGTVVNAGSVIGSGGTAVAFDGTSANRLIVDPSAGFGGSVVAQGTGNVLELASAAGVGTIAGIGTGFSGFGTVQVDDDAKWVVADAVSGGTIDIGAGSDLTLMGGAAASAPVDFVTNTGTLGLGDPTDFAATVFGFQRGDAIDFTSVSSAGSITAGVDGSNELTLSSGGVVLAKVQLDPSQSFSGVEFAAAPDGSGGTVVTETLCFCAGTMIATPSGEVPVEQLAVGSLVLTASGTVRPITWVGVGQVMATRGRRGAATPVIVRRSALTDNVPHRDLHVTKGHSVYLDGALIPVEFLVNHRSILWDDQAQVVSLYHIELETHDVLVANGAPLESYRDDGNRWLFQNANAGWGLPEKAPYAPVLTGGAAVDAAWRRLLDRSGPRKGFPLTDDADLHLVVDGVRMDAVTREDGLYSFNLLTMPATIRIVSRASVPQELGLARDPRSLGVALRRILVRRATKFRVIEVADPRLAVGFHAFEASNGFRWTDGDSVLPVELFGDFGVPAVLTLQLWSTAQYVAEGDARQQAA